MIFQEKFNFYYSIQKFKLIQHRIIINVIIIKIYCYFFNIFEFLKF